MCFSRYVCIGHCASLCLSSLCLCLSLCLYWSLCLCHHCVLVSSLCLCQYICMCLHCVTVTLEPVAVFKCPLCLSWLCHNTRCRMYLAVSSDCLDPPSAFSHPHPGSRCTEDTTQLQPTALPLTRYYIPLLRTTAQGGSHLRVAPISEWHPSHGSTQLRVVPMSRWHPCQDGSRLRMDSSIRVAHI